MTRSLEEYGRIEEELVALLRKLLAELPPNAASLEVRPVSNNGIVAVLKPTNPAAASIVTHAENALHLIDFSFGEYEPTWELPIDLGGQLKTGQLGSLQNRPTDVPRT